MYYRDTKWITKIRRYGLHDLVTALAWLGWIIFLLALFNVIKLDRLLLP